MHGDLYISELIGFELITVDISKPYLVQGHSSKLLLLIKAGGILLQKAGALWMIAQLRR